MELRSHISVFQLKSVKQTLFSKYCFGSKIGSSMVSTIVLHTTKLKFFQEALAHSFCKLVLILFLK